MKLAALLLSTGLGLGFLPLAPGTWASLSSLGLVALAHQWGWMENHSLILPALVALAFFPSLWATRLTASSRREADPACIVLDEVLGQLVALSFVPLQGVGLLLAFFLFRLFDIVKPFPLRRLETFPGGWGILLDDLAAGALAGVAARLFLFLWL